MSDATPLVKVQLEFRTDDTTLLFRSEFEKKDDAPVTREEAETLERAIADVIMRFIERRPVVMTVRRH